MSADAVGGVVDVDVAAVGDDGGGAEVRQPQPLQRPLEEQLSDRSDSTAPELRPLSSSAGVRREVRK